MRQDITTDRVYRIMLDHANEDGVAEITNGEIAVIIQRPARSVRRAMKRLQTRGQILMMTFGSYVITDLVDDLPVGE